MVRKTGCWWKLEGVDVFCGVVWREHVMVEGAAATSRVCVVGRCVFCAALSQLRLLRARAKTELKELN